MANIPINETETYDVLRCVKPIWLDKSGTATQAAIRRAKAEGKKLDRQGVVTPEREEAAIATREPRYRLAVVAEKMGVNRSAIQRLERQAGD